MVLVSSFPENKESSAMKTIFRLTIFVFAFLRIHSAIAAETCDPAKFLKYEDIQYSRDIATQLYFLDSFKQNNSSHDEFAGQFGWGTMGINHDGVRDVASELSKQLRIDYTQKEKTGYTISKLSTTGKDAYVDCLKNNLSNYSIVFSDDATQKDQFFIVIRSHPKQDGPNPKKISIDMINGKVISADKSVRNFEQARAKVSRNLSAGTEIAITVGNETEFFSLPPKPTTKLIFETRSFPNPPEEHEIYGGNDETIRTMCVELPNAEQDATIVKSIPLEIVTNASISNMGVIGRVPSTTSTMTPRKACAQVYWHLSSSDGRIKGTAQVAVTVARVVPNN